MENNNYGMSFSSVLFLIFLVLKLTNVIDWSWWWITAPLWGGILLWIILIMADILFFGALALLCI